MPATADEAVKGWHLPTWAKITASGIALATLVVKTLYPPRVDWVSVALIALLFLPWIVESIVHFKGFGIELDRAPLKAPTPAEKAQREVEQDIEQQTAQVSEVDRTPTLSARDFEAQAIAALEFIGFPIITRDRVVETPAGRIWVDAVAWRVRGSQQETILVEAKANASSRLPITLAELRYAITAYSVARPRERVSGLLILQSAERLREYMDRDPLIAVATFNPATGMFDFPFGLADSSFFIAGAPS